MIVIAASCLYSVDFTIVAPKLEVKYSKLRTPLYEKPILTKYLAWKVDSFDLLRHAKTQAVYKSTRGLGAICTWTGCLS